MNMNFKIGEESLKVLRNAIGKRLTSLTHEPFYFRACSFGIVDLTIEKTVLSITSEQTPQIFFDGKEDLCLQKVKEIDNVDDAKFVGGVSVTETIKSKIENIAVVNSFAVLTRKKDKKVYQIEQTNGILFSLEDNYQVLLEFDLMMETIDIYRGYNAMNHLKELKAEFIESYSSLYDISKYELESLSLK